MRTKKDIMNLIKNGLKIETISRLTESQIKTLSEKFNKKEVDETVTKITTTLTQYQTDQNKDAEIPVPTGTKSVSVSGTQTPGKTTLTPMKEGEVTERFESKAQQGLFWVKCNKTKGKEKKKWCDMAKEFSDDTTKKDYEKMPEKKHPEKTVKYKKEKSKVEEQLENEIVKLIEGHINPSMTKGDFLKVILEKTKKEDSMILSKPKKMTMFSKDEGKEMKTMDKPIGKLFGMGKELGEDTKEKEKTKEKTKEKDKDGNPFKDPNRKFKERTKARFGKDEMSENTETAPVKPGTKEKTKPGKDKNPFKRPGPKEQPKAKKGKEEKKNEFISVIKQALNLM